MTTTEITFPLFIFEGYDLTLFSSLVEAESKLELIDVDNGVYVGYDADGRALKIEERDEYQVRFIFFGIALEMVHISLAESTPTHAEELAGLLRSHLEGLGATAEPTDDLDQLVEKCKVVHRYGEKPRGCGCFALVFLFVPFFLLI